MNKKTAGALLLGLVVGFAAGWFARPQQTEENTEAQAFQVMRFQVVYTVQTEDLFEMAEQAEGDLDCPPPEEVQPEDEVCGQPLFLMNEESY